MQLDVQFGTAAIEDIVRRLAEKQLPALRDRFVHSGLLGQAVVDHLVVRQVSMVPLAPRMRDIQRLAVEDDTNGGDAQSQPRITRQVKGDAAGVAIDIDARIVSEGNVTDVPLELDDYSAASFTVIFRILATTGTDPTTPILKIDYEGIQSEPASMTPALRAVAEDGFRELEQEVPLPLEDLTGFLGAQTEVMNAGLARRSGEVCLRLELNGIDAPAEQRWQRFFDGDWVSRRGLDAHWAVFLDQRLLVAGARARLDDNLVDKPGEVVFLPDDRDVSWDNVAPGDEGYEPKGLRLGFTARLDDACPGTPIHVDLDTHVGFRLHLNEPGIIETRTRMELAAHDGDVAACGSKMGGPLGAVIGAFAGGPIGALIGAAVGALAGTIVMAIVVSEADADDDMRNSVVGEGQCRDVTTDPEKVIETVCEMTAGLPEVGFLPAVVPDQLVADKDGLSLRGRMPATVKTFVAEAHPGHRLEIQTTSAGWRFEGDCSTKSATARVDGGEIRASTKTGDPLRVATPHVVGDDLALLTPAVTYVGPTAASMRIEVDPDRLDQYYAAPYPIEVIVPTSLGHRRISLGSIPPPPTQKQHMQATADLVSDCAKASHDFWGRTSRLDPRWLIDPPFERIAGRPDILHHWRIAVEGAMPDEIVSLEVDGSPTVSGTADDRGSVIIEAVLDRDVQPSVTRAGNVVRGIEGTLVVTQRLLMREGRISLGTLPEPILRGLGITSAPDLRPRRLDATAQGGTLRVRRPPIAEDQRTVAGGGDRSGGFALPQGGRPQATMGAWVGRGDDERFVRRSGDGAFVDVYVPVKSRRWPGAD